MSALIIHGENQVSLSISGEVEQQKNDALAKSAMVGAVENQDQLTVAADAMVDVSAVIKAVEKSRKDVKKPFLDWGRKIDATAEKFIEELKAEEIRVRTLIGNYETEQRTIRLRAEAEARAKQEEIERQAREAQLEALRKQAQAEAEATRLAAAAKSKSAKAAVEAMRQEAEAKAQAELKAIEERKAQEMQAAAAMTPEREKPAGIAVRSEWDFEVVDLPKLCRARYDLCRVEPNRSAIKEAINLGVRDIPGIRVFEKTSVRTMGHAQQKLIDV